VRLGELCEIKTQFPDADFWIVRRGTAESVGKPTKEYNPEHFGIKVTKTEVLVPQYLYYLFEYLHGKGHFQQLATGTLRLVGIRRDDIANIKFGE